MKNKLQFCVRCLYSSEHPLNVTFNEKGLCSGCQIHEEKDSLDWNARLEKLKKIISQYKTKKGNYDCIVPITGANDSYYILHLVINVLKLNPLLVHYNSYFNTQLAIKNLTNLRIKFNRDIIIKNVNPIKVKKITKDSLINLRSMYWHVLAGQTVFPVQASIDYKIPLIIWGAHQGIEQVGMFSYTQEVEMTRRYRKNHDLMGCEATDLIKPYQNLNEEDVFEYFYPSFKDLVDVGTKGIYLNNYFRWDPKWQHEKMIKLYDYKTGDLNRTFDTYDYNHCYNYMDIHDYIKLCKHGYSKVTDHASREIRFGRISREQGLELVKIYETKKLKYSKLFTQWLGIKDESLNYLFDRFKNPKYWKRTDASSYEQNLLSSKIEISKRKDTTKKKFFFIKTDKINLDSKPKYIIFGKGYEN
jgi:N-acetyl sugar amidotransferase